MTIALESFLRPFIFLGVAYFMICPALAWAKKLPDSKLKRLLLFRVGE